MLRAKEVSSCPCGRQSESNASAKLVPTSLWKSASVYECFPFMLPYDARRGDLSVSRFTCPRCRLYRQVDYLRVASNSPRSVVSTAHRSMANPGYSCMVCRLHSDFSIGIVKDKPYKQRVWGIR